MKSTVIVLFSILYCLIFWSCDTEPSDANKSVDSSATSGIVIQPENSSELSYTKVELVQSTVKQLKLTLESADTPEEEAAILTLLCYYGTFFGLGDEVDLIPFPYADVPVWELTKEMLRDGQQHLDLMCTYEDIPIILLDHVEVFPITDKQYYGYSVQLKQVYKDTLSEDIVAFTVGSHFSYGRFSRWFYIDKYGGLVYGYGQLRDTSANSEHELIPDSEPLLADNSKHGMPTNALNTNQVNSTPGWMMYGHDAQHTRRSCYVGAQTSTLKWTFTTGDAVNSSPSIDGDGTVYFGSDDYNLYAINPNGTKKWAFITEGKIRSSPAISADGTIYVGSDDYKLYAINSDGTEKWSYATENCVYSSPVIGVDGTVYVGSNDDKLYAISPKGNLRWIFITLWDVKSSPAIGADGTIYVGSDDSRLYAINPDGSMKWNYQTGASLTSSPTIGKDGTVYIGSYDHNMYAIRPDGILKWLYTTGDQIVYSPALGSDETIYFGSDDCKFYAINPDGTKKWSYITPESIWFTPAIGADGVVYLGCTTSLFAFDVEGNLQWSYAGNNYVKTTPAIGVDGTVYVGCCDNQLYAIGLP